MVDTPGLGPGGPSPCGFESHPRHHEEFMSEMIKTYSLDEPDKAVAMDRADFYSEQVKEYKKTGKPSRACDIVDIIIFNEAGEMFIQKRSNQKAHNAGLLDKSIGGHVVYGDATDYTVMVETVQELQVPSIVLRNDQDYTKTLKILKDYLNTVAVIKHVDTKIFHLEKVIKDEKIAIANKVHLYFGIYGGRVKTVDQEAKGILQYTLEGLEHEVEKFPEMFTYDLRFFIKEYRQEIVDFVKHIKS